MIEAYNQLATLSVIASYNIDGDQPRHTDIVSYAPSSKGSVSSHTQYLLQQELVAKHEKRYSVNEDRLWQEFAVFFDHNLQQQEELSKTGLNDIRRHIAQNQDRYYEKLRTRFHDDLLQTLAEARQAPHVETLRDVFRVVERDIHDYAVLNGEDDDLLAISLTTYRDYPYDTNDKITTAVQRIKEDLL